MIAVKQFLRSVSARVVWGQDENERGFAARLFCACVTVYAFYFNPYIQSSMTWNFMDLAASLVETGRPYLTQTGQYGAVDTARTVWGTASAEPLGPSLLLVPLYAILKVSLGGASVSLPVLNALAILLFSIPAAAAIAVLIYLQARRFSGDERYCRMVAWLGAFGTQVFPMSTMYTKEVLGTLAGFAAYHLASRVRDGKCAPSARHFIVVGFLASAAGLMVYPLWILVFGLAWYLRPWLDLRCAGCFLLGTTPIALLLLVYNHATFGHPLIVGYLTPTDPVGSRVAWPTVRMLWDLTLGPAGGVMFYHPMLALTPIALWIGWRSPGIRRDIAFAAGLFVVLLLVYGAWLVSGYDNNVFVASLGLRMLLPTVPVLVSLLAVLEGKWRVLVGWLGLLSLLSGISFASAGLVPGGVLPVIYVVKVAATTMAGGLFFADALPRMLGVETVHTVIASQQISAAKIWVQPDLPILIVRQFCFRIVGFGLFLGMVAIFSRMRFAGFVNCVGETQGLTSRLSGKDT